MDNDVRASLLSKSDENETRAMSVSMKTSMVNPNPSNLMEVFKLAASRGKDISPTILPFTVAKEQLALTIDSNLVYYD